MSYGSKQIAWSSMAIIQVSRINFYVLFCKIKNYGISLNICRFLYWIGSQAGTANAAQFHVRSIQIRASRFEEAQLYMSIAGQSMMLIAGHSAAENNKHSKQTNKSKALPFWRRQLGKSTQFLFYFIFWNLQKQFFKSFYINLYKIVFFA